MPIQTNFLDETPALDGPDYVALVIEWDELADDLERQIRGEELRSAANLDDSSSRWRTIGLVAAGALGVIALAYGVIHKLRS